MTEDQQNEILRIIDEYQIKVPRHWEELSYSQKLDFLGERILMGTRTSKKHSYLKEQGWLSSSQLERRKRREIYGKVDDFRDINVRRSNNPDRIYVSPDTPSSYTVPSGGVPVKVSFTAPSGHLVASGASNG